MECFTFLWKLRNISYSIDPWEKTESPSFVVDAIGKTKWKLWLYLIGWGYGNNTNCYLVRDADCKGPYEVEIEYELELITRDDSVLKKTGRVKKKFIKGASFGTKRNVPGENVISDQPFFLPEDTLWARCKIWKTVGETTKNVECTASTTIGVEKKTVKWIIKSFSSLKSGKKCNHQIKSILNDVSLLSIDLSLTKGLNSEENISFDLCLRDQTVQFSTLRLFLIDSSGNRVKCNQEEIWFDDPAQCKQLTFSFTFKKLCEERRVYLPDDTLTLLWEWGFSKGIVSEEIEADINGCICTEEKISNALNANTDKITLLNSLADNMKSLYDENFLSDVKLKTNSCVFPAHKFILSTSSPVFKAMFSSDTKERGSDCVIIEGTSDDTIRQMLHFIYSTRVEDLTLKSAIHLYVAADKYDILSLKNICSSYIKERLSASVACGILLLSNVHGDDDLKSAVHGYILKHGKQITNCDEWETLIEANAKLAAETMSRSFK